MLDISNLQLLMASGLDFGMILGVVIALSRLHSWLYIILHINKMFWWQSFGKVLVFRCSIMLVFQSNSRLGDGCYHKIFQPTVPRVLVVLWRIMIWTQSRSGKLSVQSFYKADRPALYTFPLEGYLEE